MTKTTVDRYLRELDRELQDLPPARRRELLDEIREHIDSALQSSDDEAEVRTVLDRLGEPDEIAEEARRRFGITRAGPGLRETFALVLLPIGGIVLPVLGWFVGATLLVTSRVGTTREKVVGLLVFPRGPAAGGRPHAVATRMCASIETSGAWRRAAG